MIYNLTAFIKGFDPKNIKVGDTIITKSNGTIKVESIMKHGWDYNYGDLIWFKEGNKSLSSMDLIQRNERNFRKMTK